MSALPRATVISTRSMELLRSRALEAEVRAGGVEAEALLLSCETLAQVEAGVPLEAGYPTVEQSARVSPTAPAVVPQDHLEPVMLRHLAELAASRVHFGTELVAIDQADGIRATLRDRTSGEEHVVSARVPGRSRRRP